MTPFHPIGLALSLLLLMLVAPAPTRALERDPAAAVQEFHRGEAEFAAENYDAAADRFQRAFALDPDPAYLFNVGVSFEHAGRWHLALLAYERFLEVAGESAAAPEVRRRQQAAKQALEAVMAVVSLTGGPRGAPATVDDGWRSQRCELPCDLHVIPGPVTVHLGDGQDGRRLSRQLTDKERWEIAEDAPLVVQAPPPAAIGSEVWIAAGLSGAALVTGTIFGALALSDQAEGERIAARGEVGQVDRARLERLAGRVEGRALAADLSFGAAIIGAGVTLVLALTGGGDDAAVSREGVAWRLRF